MTAPTQDEDEAKLRHFLRVKPLHTGFHLTPEQRKIALEPWWFADEMAVERHEEVERFLFCRECVEVDEPGHGVLVHKMMIDYQADPLKSVQALCSTHCRHCGKGEMYPVEKLDWDIGNPKVISVLLRHTDFGRRHDDMEAMIQGMQQHAQPAQWLKNQRLAKHLAQSQQVAHQNLQNQFGGLGVAAGLGSQAMGIAGAPYGPSSKIGP